MTLDELLEERYLFIAHQSAHDWAKSQMAQAVHTTENIRNEYGPIAGALMGHAHCATACVRIVHAMQAMRNAGQL